MLVHLMGLLLCTNFLKVFCEQIPVIVFITPEQHKSIGEAVEFTCALSYDKPEYSVFWMKENSILSNNSLVISKDKRLKIKHSHHNNSYTLVLDHLQDSDSGDYECQILYEQKTISNITKLMVFVEEVPSLVKPMFISKPMNITVNPGDNVTLPCNVDNLGNDYALLWKKETAVLSISHNKISHNPRLELFSNWDLKITSILPEDAGIYICQISSLDPMELKHLVLLNAVPTTSIVTTANEKVTDIVKKVGEELKLICKVSENPSSKVMWKKINAQLPPENLTFSGSVLHFPSLHKEDSGIYICTVSNGIGNNNSTSFRLYIQFAPIVHSAKTQVITGVGLTAQLSCEFETFPLANLTWHINDQKIENQLHYSMFNDLTENGKKQISTLKIKNVTQDDFANYTCSGTNKFGTSKSVIEVTGMPTPITIKGNNSIKPTNYHIEWRVKSYSPILGYKLRLLKVDKISKQKGEWLEQDIRAENREGQDQQQTFDFSDLDPETTYQVVMKAENQYGWNHDSNVLEFTTGSLINQPEFKPSQELDVGKMKPEQSQQPETVDAQNTSHSQPSSMVYILTIGIIMYFFWL